MSDIIHYFPIHDDVENVFPLISTSEGLSKWWTKSCVGVARAGEKYELGFGPGYRWEAVVEQVKTSLCFRASNDNIGQRLDGV